MRHGLAMVSEPALERVTRVVGDDRVWRVYGLGVGKLYLHVYRTRIPRVVRGLAPEEGGRGTAKPEDGFAAQEASDGGDDAGCTEVVESVRIA